ncbi:MAG: TonB-dependent receptor plug domain-containing protein [Gammaproteobacteria bacterium]|nr:TonB-dependent receptor plug domain-containing protein [Gammaproteobacteria bacterium]
MKRRLASFFTILALSPSLGFSQNPQASAAESAPEVASVDDLSVVYKADYFDQFQPVSVNDMVSRIPGIGLALGGGGGGGSRGLGGGAGEILINGQRITGKSNEGRSQLSRISADDVDYIEIIRGTSEDIDVRGGGQVVNIVLLAAQSRSSIAAEISTDRMQDGKLAPGARLSYSGQNGNLNYLFHIQGDPNYVNQVIRESSFDPQGLPTERRFEESTRDQTNYESSINLGYQFEKSMVQLNALYGQTAPPTDITRGIIGLAEDNPSVNLEREANQGRRDNWELGGDYEYSFDNRSKFRFLFIVNDRDFDFTRERFQVGSDEETKDLFLFSAARDRERIARSSYTFNLLAGQAIETGVEIAQTIRDSEIRLGNDDEGGEPSAAHGGLFPVDVDNALSSVEEIRSEYFAIHNWQLTDSMSLETALVYESSEITQSGDVGNSRSFGFFKPRVDYRYNLTESLQFRATAEKTVSQLSFSDFSATTDNSDDDQDTIAGNPNIRQEQTWRYDLNLEYRLPNNIGVLNSKFYYRDVSDVIDRIDVSPSPDNLQSARGNIGNGTRYGLNLDASTQLSYLGLPNALFTVRLGINESELLDPFLGIERRFGWSRRWNGRTEFRHDVNKYNLSYGFNYSTQAREGSNYTRIDVFDIEREIPDYDLNLFFEKRAFGGVTFRFDMRNANDRNFCRERTRFDGATVDGIVEEIENSCRQPGVRYSLKIRNTF